jgi:hypothetical protein
MGTEEKYLGEGQGREEEKTRVILQQTKEHQEPLEVRTGKEQFSPGDFVGLGHCM